MIRDKIKDSNYFEKYIQQTIDRKSKYIGKIESLENPQQGYVNSAVTLDLFTRNILISKYSNGDSIENIAIDYQESLKWFELVYNSRSFYVQLLWMISIGILLDINEEQFNKLVHLIKEDNPDDYLVDFFLSNRIEVKNIHDSFRFPIPYKALYEVIILAQDNRKNDAILRLKKYLDTEWYKGHSDSGWYDNHKSKHDTYAGYWSFESAALVKILQLDDASLKEQQYYPYDLVHWKD
ncbi:DUF1911 domain-containing protein [Chryseobacterium joostei]|uniref:DUF1911 domain-containing protein n=1 Tax=Chryseobacterium joostei TaxID=112234 RepID=A0A1N7ILK2_9FLAO|nr:MULTISPECIES: PoNi-like cognate immunity protein [Chryseobacterium]AZA98532.1 DUF1911 domain-containing protein [Chryseobacterium joostei]SIS37949.1 protein of unknown function [Chryseobacterium joostei]HCM35925.1 DUF1911 domain-containing protein [Chryseobacterium sp.]